MDAQPLSAAKAKSAKHPRRPNTNSVKPTMNVIAWGNATCGIRNAHEQVKEANAWRVDEIALTLIMNDDRWVYIVSFSPPPSENANESLASPFKIVVLMDGTVVKATLFKPNQ